MKAQKDMEFKEETEKAKDSRRSQEVVARPTRRAFTAEYKRRILAEIDGCHRGEIGLVLRREGLYSSHIDTWRQQLEKALTPKKRGRKPVERNPLQSEVEQLRRETTRLQERLRQAETIIAVQKKVSEMLGLQVTEEQS